MTVFAADPDLLQRFRKGDRHALACIYETYVGLVESLIRRGLGEAVGRSSAHAVIVRADLADLVQEVFLKAFAREARQAYDGVREYRPFLVAIAHNALVEHLRKRGREVRVDFGEMERLAGSESSGDVDADPWADPQTMRVVEGYLRTLSADEHAVYVQRYVHGHSQLQAAAALGISRQHLRSVEAHLRRGLERALARAKLRVQPSSREPLASPPRGPETAPTLAEPENP